MPMRMSVEPSHEQLIPKDRMVVGYSGIFAQTSLSESKDQAKIMREGQGLRTV